MCEVGMLESLQQEVLKLQEKEKRLKEIEVFCQQKKEILLTQCRKLPHFTNSTNEVSQVDQKKCYANQDKQYMELVTLFTQIHQLEEKTEELVFRIRNSAAKNERYKVSQAFKDYQILSHQLQNIHSQACEGVLPLQKWYLQMLDFSDVETQRQNPAQLLDIIKQERLKVPDMPVYDVEYKKENIKEEPVSKRKAQTTAVTRPEGNGCLACYQLSFMTRRRGLCIHIVIQAKINDKSSHSQDILSGVTEPPSSRNTVELEETVYTIVTDPYVSGMTEKAIDALQQELHPIKFVKEILWPAIDISF